MRCSICKIEGHKKNNGKFHPKEKTDVDISVEFDSIMNGNDKRKASCKAVGGEKKRTGHKREDLFGKQFCEDTPVTFKAEADKTITNSCVLEHLQDILGPFENGNTSIKSGNNLQFTLGRIDEITKSSNKLASISSPALWNKYLAKSESASPASLLCYYSSDGWDFFRMSDVIDYIVKNAHWHELDSGRLKGYFNDSSRKGTRQYLTYEYRTTHKSHFLGANGNKGEHFIKLLKANIKNVRVTLDEYRK